VTGLNLLIIPKEEYPLKRVRLTKLFLEEYTKKDNIIYWSLLSHSRNQNQERISDGNNIFQISPSLGSGTSLKNLLIRYYKFKKYKSIKNILTENKVDLIVSNDGIIEGFLGLHYAKKFHIPFAFYLSSLFFDFDRRAYKKTKNIKNFYKFIESYPKEILLNFIIKKAYIFHPISNGMGYYFREKNKNIFTLPLCIGTEFTNTKIKRKKHNEHVKILYIGAIGEIRELEIYIEIIKRIIEMGLTCQLDMYGKPTNNRYVKKLKSIIRSYELEDYINIYDELPYNKIPELMNDYDIGLSIIPSTKGYSISSPTKIVEYLSRSLPVVANREIFDQKTVIEQSGGGLLADYDVSDITLKLKKLIKNYEIRINMGEKGKKWVEFNRNYKWLAMELDRFYIHEIEKYRSSGVSK